MEKLSIEQKAKAYDEALKQIKECTPDENGFITIYPQEIFPELKESEDERIRKWLIALIRSNEYGSISDVGVMPCSKSRVLAWLEKQGEQKPAWSEEVDLEKEIQDHIRECLDVKFPTTNIELIKKDVAYTAKKFFELGLKTQKGE